MNKQVSVVIRNKNEAEALDHVLDILKKLYSGYIKEIIIVDNNSTDESLEIAQKYQCVITTITEFTYGGAINQGVSIAKSQYILLLSSHSVPVGTGFFENTFKALDSLNVAGIRYVNSFDNYRRAVNNQFTVKDPLKFGLMGACCLINKEVWEDFKFDPMLPAIEDKEWSKRVIEKGYKIIDLNETYFYFIRRNFDSSHQRFKKETIAEYQLYNKKFSSPIRSLLSFLKKIIWTNHIRYIKTIGGDFKMLKTKLEIYASLKNRKSNR